MALTDTAIRNAKPRERDYKLADAGGLYLLVTPAAGRLWRLKYRANGIERKLALGKYPAVTLGEARKVDPISSPMKAKGVGELGICGAVANAVYNATGIRVRDYPITLDKLLERMPDAA